MPDRSLKKLSPRHFVGPLKVGVIGVGYLGKFHAEKYAANPDVELVGLADILLPRAKEIAERLGTKAFANYRDLLPKVEAVSVVVPTDQHHRVAKDFLLAGKDVLLEKPITSTIEQAEDLIATAKKNGCLLQAGHLERFNPAFLAVKDRIQSPLFIEAHRLTPFRGRGVEVDVVLDLMIHDLDILLDMVGSPVDHIHAVGVPVLTGKVDIANARLQFESGCVANITASRISVEDQRRFRVFQPDTYMTIDFTAKKVNLYRRESFGEGKSKIIAEQVDVRPGDALESEIRSFVNSSLHRDPPVVTGIAGERALALAFEVNKKIRENIEKIPSIGAFYTRGNDLEDSSW